MSKRAPNLPPPPPDDPNARPIISQRAAALSKRLAPIAAAVNRYLKHPCRMDESGACQIGNRPWVAPLNYMITLYSGIESTLLEGYCRKFKIAIPNAYRELLQEVNGAFIFGISLFGIPSSMLSRGLLDRSTLQCHDLSTAVLSWSREYRVDQRLFHFGGRDFSDSENIGYFLDEKGKIISARESGEILNQWTEIAKFLSDELAASEALEESLHPACWHNLH